MTGRRVSQSVGRGPTPQPETQSNKDMELFQASQQWMTRPSDQRFWDVAEMRQRCKDYADSSEVITETADRLTFEADITGEVYLHCDAIREPVRMTYHGFSQVCTQIGAPPSYLRSLGNPSLTADCLNHGHRRIAPLERDLLVDWSSGRPLLRAQTSQRYSRLWNYEIAQQLHSLERHGWRVPPARPVWGDTTGHRVRTAMDSDIIDFGVESPLSVKVGDDITPSGLYASDHDMFAFMVNPDTRIDDGSDGGLMRGFFLWNSEIGTKSIGATSFLLRTVCGNHIVWGAEEVFTLRMVHTGDVMEKLQALIGELGLRVQRSAEQDERRIKELQTTAIGASGEEVVDFLQSKRLLSRKKAAAAFEVGEQFREIDGDPTTFYGMANAITRYSQSWGAHADERAAMDDVAGKLIAMCK